MNALKLLAVGLPKFVHGVKQAVAEPILEHVPEFFDGIEFRPLASPCNQERT